MDCGSSVGFRPRGGSTGRCDEVDAATNANGVVRVRGVRGWVADCFVRSAIRAESVLGVRKFLNFFLDGRAIGGRSIGRGGESRERRVFVWTFGGWNVRTLWRCCWRDVGDNRLSYGCSDWSALDFGDAGGEIEDLTVTIGFDATSVFGRASDVGGVAFAFGIARSRRRREDFWIRYSDVSSTFVDVSSNESYHFPTKRIFVESSASRRMSYCRFGTTTNSIGSYVGFLAGIRT